jgi:hypothetical protein
MANVEEKILDIKVRYDDAIRAIAKYQGAVDAARLHEAELKKQLKDNQISRAQYNAEMAATKVVIQDNNEAIRVLNKEIQNNRKIQRELENGGEGSLKSLRAELSNLTAEYDSLSRAERNAAKGKELEDKINAITDELKGAEEETQRFYRNVGNYEESIKRAVGINSDFANSLLNISQNSQGLKGFMSNVKTEIFSFSSALTGLLKNKVFLGIAGIAGAGFAFKWWYDYNQGIKEATKLTKQFTDYSGNQLKEYRSEVQALADYYGKDFKETLLTINTLTQQFGIENEKAQKIIKDGFVAGADANDDYFDSIKEYSAQFKEAGLSADEFVAIIAQTSRMGIFSDKGIDTIKEANIRLREMTTSTADALDGIGISSKRVQQELQSGYKTTFQIMQEVSARLNELPDSSQKVGTAIADIFGNMGEDAGLKYIRTLKDISTDLDSVKKKTGELGKAEEDLLTSQTELTKEISLLFDATGGAFEKMESKVKSFVNDVLSSLVRVVRTAFESIDEIAERETWQAKELGKSVASEGIADEYAKIAVAQENYIKQGLSEEEALKKAKEDRLKMLKLSLVQEEQYLKYAVSVNEKYNKELKDASFWRQGLGLDRTNSAINNDIASSWTELMNQTAAVESLKETMKLISSYNPNGVTKTSGDNVPDAEALEAKKKEIEEIRKAEDELLKLIKDGREKQSQEIKLQYDRQIEDLRSRLATETDLTSKARVAINKQIYALEQQKTQALQKLNDEELQKELDNRQKLISIQLESVKEGSEQEYQLRMQQLVAARDSELAEKELTEQMRLAIVAKYNKQIDDLSAQHDSDILRKQQEAIQLRYETEIALAYGNEQEILRIRLEQKQAELDSIQQLEGESTEAFNLRKIEMQNEYLATKQELANKEIEIEQTKYEAAASIAGGLSSVFDSLGEDNKAFAILSKTLALAEIAINTGKAIAAGTAQAMSVPFPANLAAIATTVATVLSNISTAINTVKSAKFATGGLVTGPGSGTSDSVPAQLSNGESVLTASATSMFAPLLSAFNQMGGGIPINVTESSNQALGEDMLARAVAKGVMMAPAPIVSVEEFTSVANRVKYVENLGNV